MRSTASKGPPLAEASLTLPATAEHLSSVYALLARFWKDLQRCHSSPPDTAWRAQFDTAVGEIVTNIMRYAYPSPSSRNEILIAIQGFGDRVEATFRDSGAPYAGPSISGAAAPSDCIDELELPESGRGLGLTLAVVDHLSYTREADVNSWRVIKRL